ncbi:MAG: sugar transferase [Actinobacteria bacterium]|nr:sugar transferase [Actinomycetota bacterium]
MGRLARPRDLPPVHHLQSAMMAQRRLRLVVFCVLPALAAGVLAGLRFGDLGFGAISAVAVFAACRLGERERIPMHLMPLSTFVVRALAPVLGLGLALLLNVVYGEGREAIGMLVPLVGAWLVLALGSWAMPRYLASHQVRVAMVSSPGLAVAMAYELKSAGIRSYEVVGWLADGPPAAEPSSGPRWLGSLDDVRGVVERHEIELLVYSSGVPGHPGEPQMGRLELFERVAASCLDLPVRLLEASRLYEELLGHVPLGQSTSAWFQYLMHPRYRPGSSFSKRAFDVVVGSGMLVILSPALACFAVAVKLSDRGPVFYRQRRVGEGGREFEMIKLRSMRVAAETDGAQWARSDDDRVTSVGALMRRLHIDEMPQLWNVIRGQMTIVGPRPERRQIVSSLERQLPYYDRRHLVKPGLAGWAQACCGYAGSEQGTSWKLCHDLYYLKHRSVYFDMLVLLENVRVSVSGVQFGLDAPQEQFILGHSDQLQ